MRIGPALRGLAIPAFIVALLPTAASAQDTIRVSVDGSGAEANGASNSPTLSSDTRIVLFSSVATNLVASDTNSAADVFIVDRTTGSIERISVDSSGAEGNGDSLNTPWSMSPDGQFVAFLSLASNLVANDTNNDWDVLVRDRVNGTVELASVDSAGMQGNAASYSPAISADGRVVAFTSMASNLVSGDTNRWWDVFVRDLAAGTTERVSVSSTGAEGDDHSDAPVISADGSLVFFSSFAHNLVSGDTNQASDVFVHDRASGSTERVSLTSSGGQSNGSCIEAAISPDGRFVAFTSIASNLVAGDSNGSDDVFVRDRLLGTTTRVSVGSKGAQSNNGSHAPSIAADGRSVVFLSYATNLVKGDTNGDSDVFLHALDTGETRRMSVDSSGGQANGGAGWWIVAPMISADGLVVAFSDDATNLVNGDSNATTDVFLHELCSTPARWSNYGSGFAGTNGIPALTARSNPAFGTSVTVDVENSYGAPTTGLLFVGLQSAYFHSSWGGDLLLVPSVVLPINFSYGGDWFTGDVPLDDSLCGVSVYVQVIEADPGAARGVSFTAGLELVLGT